MCLFVVEGTYAFWVASLKGKPHIGGLKPTWVIAWPLSSENQVAPLAWKAVDNMTLTISGPYKNPGIQGMGLPEPAFVSETSICVF